MRFLLSFPLVFLLGCVPLRHESFGVDQMQSALGLIDQGTAHLRLQQWDEAQAAFQVAIETVPLAAAYDGLGCVAFGQRDYILARKYFERALEIDPTYTYSFGNLALLQEVQGENETASQTYQLAIKHNPGEFRFRNNFGAFISSTDPAAAQAARAELLRAQALVNHPIIQHNLTQIQ